jgi:hypothetical protein
MRLKTTIAELVDAHLADQRKLDIVGFVDQLLTVASENGAVRGTCCGDQAVQFTVRDPSRAVAIGVCDNHGELEVVYTLRSPFARGTLRMMCARLGVLCQESTGREINLYGDQGVIEQGDVPRRRWKVSFTNTPAQQEFLIERL